MKSLSTFRPGRRGFSLTEMLIVIAVMGIIAAVALPVIGRIADSTSETTARINAQQLGSLSTNLATLGVGHVVPESLGGKEATGRLLRHGIFVPSGPMAGSFFGLPSLAEEGIPPATVYLDISYGDLTLLKLIYNGHGEP